MLFDRLHRGTALLWAAGTGILAATAIALAATPPAGTAGNDDSQIAKSLATMLSAGRTVVSRHQATINDANLANKGFDSASVLAEATKIYQDTAGVDPMSIDPNSRHGKLIRMQMDSIAEVITAHQETINRKGVGFKGFIPAVFARQVGESFGRRATGLAEMKVTAPPKLVRNPKAKADTWESRAIGEKLMAANWSKDMVFSEVSEANGKPAYRTAMPEYYAASCLSCHGSPAGEIDITGYPKEGAAVGDLGGVISITLYR